jgi:hypothetical protein
VIIRIKAKKKDYLRVQRMSSMFGCMQLLTVRDNLEDSIVDVIDAAGGDASDRRLGVKMDGRRAMVYMM